MKKFTGKRFAALKTAALLLLVVLMLGAFVLIYRTEKAEEKPETRGDSSLRYEYQDKVLLDGTYYRQSLNMTTLLVMGIDHDTNGTGSASSYKKGGQADFLRLIVINHDEQTVQQIAIDRDTLTEIAVLGVLGNRTGVRTERISLSHGFGDGKEISCQLTKEAVANLMKGIRIDHYIAMNLDGIAALNDAVDGVTLTLEEDLTDIDRTFTLGSKVTLSGIQAEAFVRARMSVGDGTNASRMRRQQQYLQALSDVLEKGIVADESYAGSVFDKVSSYLVTDMSRGELVNEVYAAKDYAKAEVLEIPGEHAVDDDGFTYFTADEEALKRLVIDVFFTEIPK